jgi:hypothetical protein
MKGLQATRIEISIGDIWQSPQLHVLLTRENDVVVARCLDFRVSSHGANIEDALQSLSEAIKEYILTSIENHALDTLVDPAHGKYWRMFNELETRQFAGHIEQSFKTGIATMPTDKIEHAAVAFSHA